jgi:mycothiol synthase
MRNEADIPRILDLVRKMPFASPHVIDLPWRLAALDLNEGRDAAFWADDDGKIGAFAACQYVWATLDFFILSSPEEQSVATQLFAWANARFQERKWPYPFWVEFRDDDQERQQLLEAHGFPQDAEDHYVLFQHTLADIPPAPVLPDGFTLRPLAGEQEAAAYTEVHRAAFESTSMTSGWRIRTLRSPHYQPELDLIVTAPDGSFAGFCVG